MNTFDLIVYYVTETISYLIPVVVYLGAIYGAYKLVKKGWL